jgi:AcrR family transcriptional regulator
MTPHPAQIAVTPRKKPTQTRSKATVDAVMAAAARILEDEGMAGFNTNAVAERAGVSIGSLYQYFPSKDAILLGLMEQVLTQFSETLSAAIDRAPGRVLGEDLTYMLQMGLSAFVNKPVLARVLEDEFQRMERHINRASVNLALREAIVRLLGRYGDAIDAPRLEIAAKELGMMARSLMGTAGERCEVDWDGMIRRIVRAMLGYLNAPWDTRPARRSEP